MKKILFIIAILSFSLMPGALNVRADSNYRFVQEQQPNFAGNFLFIQDSVTRWNPVSTSNMSFGRMTMYENRNSSKITWRSGQSSPYDTISDGEDGAVFYLSAAPKFDGDSCRYLKMVFSEDAVTVDFYSTRKALDQDSFFMEGTYEQVK